MSWEEGKDYKEIPSPFEKYIPESVIESDKK